MTNFVQENSKIKVSKIENLFLQWILIRKSEISFTFLNKKKILKQQFMLSFMKDIIGFESRNC